MKTTFLKSSNKKFIYECAFMVDFKPFVVNLPVPHYELKIEHWQELIDIACKSIQIKNKSVYCVKQFERFNELTVEFDLPLSFYKSGYNNYYCTESSVYNLSGFYECFDVSINDSTQKTLSEYMHKLHKHFNKLGFLGGRDFFEPSYNLINSLIKKIENEK